MLDKGFLQRIEFVALGQTFNGENVFALHPDGKLAARIHVAAVYDYRARPAFAAIAANFCPGKAQLIAQDFGERLAVFDLDPVRLAVNFERYSGLAAPHTHRFRNGL